MRPWAGPVAAALLGGVGLAAPARAQTKVDGHATLSFSGSYFEVISDQPFPTSATERGPAVSLSTSGSLTITQLAATHALTGSASLSLPFSSSLELVGTPLRYSFRTSYTGHFTVSERTSASLTSSVAYVPLTFLLQSGNPIDTPIDSTPEGASYMLLASATEGVTRELSEAWHLTHSGALTMTAPYDPMLIRGKTLTAMTSLSLSRTIAKDNVGLVGSFSANYFGSGEAGGISLGGIATTPTVSDPMLQFTDSLQLTWSHPWSEKLTMAMGAGATQAISPQAGGTSVSPSGTLSLAYRFEKASASLMFAHSAAANVALGSLSFIDTASTRFMWPIGTNTGLSTSGTLGFSHSTPVTGDAAAQSLGSLTTIVGDVGVNYRPQTQKLKSISFSTRGSLQRQVPSEQLAAGLTRFTVSLSVSYTYPAAVDPLTGKIATAMPIMGMTSLMPSDVTGDDPPAAPPPEEEPPAPAPDTAP